MSGTDLAYGASGESSGPAGHYGYPQTRLSCTLYGLYCALPLQSTLWRCGIRIGARDSPRGTLAEVCASFWVGSRVER
eukprot:3939685-Rhodomonas_salina.1